MFLTDICSSCGATLKFHRFDFNQHPLGHMDHLLLRGGRGDLQVRRVAPGLWEPWEMLGLRDAWRSLARAHRMDCSWARDAMSPERIAAFRERWTQDTGLSA